MRVENRQNNSPSYKALWKSTHTFSNVQKETIKEISKQLKTVHTGKFNNKTPMKWLENKGYDVFVTSSDKHKDTVKVLLSDRKKDSTNKIHPVSYVGEYNKNKPFSVGDVKKSRDEYRGIIFAFYTVATMILATITLGTIQGRKNVQKTKQNIEQVTKIVSDTVKALPKGTIAPWKNVK